MGAPQEDTSNLDCKSDVIQVIMASMAAAQRLQEDPANVKGMENLINRLKHLLLQERQTYAFMPPNSQTRKKLESLYNLIQYLESQMQRVQKATSMRGLKYYLTSISNKVLGHELGRIGQSMASKLESWLDQQSVQGLANIISKGSEDAQVKAISSFKAVVQKGYDSLLQETILSAGVVEKLAAFLEPGAASWRVQKEVAFALSALLDFNKDIFVSLVLMEKVVENILGLMNTQSDQHVLVLLHVLKSMLSAGHTIIVDEIYSQNGVPKIVDLVNHKCQGLQHAAMDCIFELAYNGRIEVVEKMFELEVVKKLARLQQSNVAAGDLQSLDCENYAEQERDAGPHNSDGNGLPATTTQMQEGSCSTSHPFANAMTRFALNLAIGIGLRKRERRALKQEFLRQIKEVMQDDVEVANITAEVLWAPP